MQKEKRLGGKTAFAPSGALSSIIYFPDKRLF
jgi:hypothetical protein